ncbi:Interferon-related developmental regulator (IFRD) [Microdochium nivale]|nr:Interferon-related developmental regulator (IFRD) [Microdochium nivale]
MHDLRKKALLESGKKTSRKARSKPQSGAASPLVSPAPSRGGSRAPSRYASEDEDAGDHSDYEQSVASSYHLSGDSDEAADGDDDANTTPWDDRLKDNVIGFLDRKNLSASSRATMLGAANHLLRYHYAEDKIDNHLNEFLPGLMKSIRNGSNKDETVRALKTLQSVIVNSELEHFHEKTFPILRASCRDSGEEQVKTESIIAMCIVTTCGGGDNIDAEALLGFLLEIIESDGHSVEAPDNGPVVSTALLGWGFVASQLDDLQAPANDAMDAFIEQLDSIDVDVQIAAGYNIALICESLREYEEETGEVWGFDYDKNQLINRMRLLTKESSKFISKKNRKQLHQSFQSVLTSLERGKGPGYSTALDEDQREFGYREKLRFGNISLAIESWALSLRVQMLNKVLRGGLAIHYTYNPKVQDLLADAQPEVLSWEKPSSRKEEHAVKKARRAKSAKHAMDF